MRLFSSNEKTSGIRLVACRTIVLDVGQTIAFVVCHASLKHCCSTDDEKAIVCPLTGQSFLIFRFWRFDPVESRQRVAVYPTSAACGVFSRR